MQRGRIVKAVSGFYYVYAKGEPIRQCRARGVFKLKGLNPLVGDYVIISEVGQSEGIIEELEERSSELIRPPLANIDQVILVFSLLEPPITFFQLDKMIAMIERQRLSLVMVFTKYDLNGADDVFESLLPVYAPMYPVLPTSVPTDYGLEALRARLSGKTSAFAGMSGVGKSSLLRRLIPDAEVETGEISKRSSRGRHTTRHAELFFLDDGFLVDTPGFSQFSFADVEPVDVQKWFRDIAELAEQCEFRGCMHECEQGCKVRESYDNGVLATSRYESYLQLLAEVKQWKARRYT